MKLHGDRIADALLHVHGTMPKSLEAHVVHSIDVMIHGQIPNPKSLEDNDVQSVTDVTGGGI